MTKPRYPFRRLRGPIVLYRSSRAAEPKMHLLRACEGLARVPDEAVVAEEYPGLGEVLALQDVRPCRLCALSSLIISACLEKDCGPPVAFTVTSQPSPMRVDGNPFSSEYRKSTESGARRITRLARRLDWSLATTSLGPVAAGVAGQAAVDFISRNLRTVALPHADANLPAVELFWTLAADTPPEAGGELAFAELWAMAERLLS